jgi:MFS family permease
MPCRVDADEPTGLTRLQKRVWLLSAMGVFLDGFDLFIIAIALPLIAVEFGANAWEQGMVGAAAVLGAIAGAVTMGRLADKAVFVNEISQAEVLCRQRQGRLKRTLRDCR